MAPSGFPVAVEQSWANRKWAAGVVGAPMAGEQAPGDAGQRTAAGHPQEGAPCFSSQSRGAQEGWGITVCDHSSGVPDPSLPGQGWPIWQPGNIGPFPDLSLPAFACSVFVRPSLRHLLPFFCSVVSSFGIKFSLNLAGEVSHLLALGDTLNAHTSSLSLDSPGFSYF